MGMNRRRAGFVLVGGRSSRMGRDKALLPLRGRTMVEVVAAAVAGAAGSATLIGNPDCYGRLGFPVIPDERSGLGPLGGIATALAASHAHWNLIAACDMPNLTTPFLESLFNAAEDGGGDCLLPEANGLPEPLCAVYHVRCLPAIREAIDRGVRKVTDGLSGLRVARLNSHAINHFCNINTPEDWALADHG